MPSPAPAARAIERAVMGLTLTRTPVADFREIHQHTEIEVSIIAGGALTTLFGDRRYARRSNRLAVCWGAVPHGAIRTTNGRPIAYSLHIPLALFNSWKLPEALVARLLHGHLIEDRPQTSPCPDLALLQHWRRLLAANDSPAREIVLHEIQARLRRLARGLRDAAPSGRAATPVHPNRDAQSFEKMLAAIHAQHPSPLTVRQIAQAAGIGPDHAMHVFREVCGVTIHEHLIQCRIFTAQRLLATTDEKVAAIGQASGFRSSDCFHSAFKRICGCTPRRYRETIRRA